MASSYRTRRIIVVGIALLVSLIGLASHPDLYQSITPPAVQTTAPADGSALSVLENLEVKGRAPKMGYARTQFGSGWTITGGCDMRNIILHRDLQNPVVGEGCKVEAGTLNDPYTGTIIPFQRGVDTSQLIQIDHVVALSNAWQTGAQQLTAAEREALANDPLNLLAVDGAANQQKSDGDAATWLPANKAFRCQYVEQQIKVKQKYRLWIVQPEKNAMQRVLSAC